MHTVRTSMVRAISGTPLEHAARAAYRWLSRRPGERDDRLMVEVMRRVLGPAEAGTMAGVGFVLLGLAAAVIVWPLLTALPLAALGVWMAVSFLVRARELRAARRRGSAGDAHAPPPGGDGDGSDSGPSRLMQKASSLPRRRESGNAVARKPNPSGFPPSRE